MNYKEITKYLIEAEHNKIKTSFSEDSEDLIIEHLLCLLSISKNTGFSPDTEYTGFYVDVGAHDHYKFSNTLKFYLKGWNGINIDADPSLISKFDKYRDRDINLNYLISNTNKDMPFYIFENQLYNTANEAVALKRKDVISKIKNIITLKSEKLEKILDQHIPYKKEIDFMSIDCEGHELEVLKSNNWEKYRPKILVVEIHCDINDINNDVVFKYLRSINYKMITKSILSSTFIDELYLHESPDIWQQHAIGMK